MLGYQIHDLAFIKPQSRLRKRSAKSTSVFADAVFPMLKAKNTDELLDAIDRVLSLENYLEFDEDYRRTLSEAQKLDLLTPRRIRDVFGDGGFDLFQEAETYIEKIQEGMKHLDDAQQNDNASKVRALTDPSPLAAIYSGALPPKIHQLWYAFFRGQVCGYAVLVALMKGDKLSEAKAKRLMKFHTQGMRAFLTLIASHERAGKFIAETMIPRKERFSFQEEEQRFKRTIHTLERIPVDG